MKLLYWSCACGNNGLGDGGGGGEVDDDDDPVSVLRLRDDPEDERLNCAAASAVPAE